MKKLAYIFLLLFSAATIAVGCREKKTPGEKIKDGVENVGDGIKDAGENVVDEVDNAVN